MRKKGSGGAREGSGPKPSGRTARIWKNVEPRVAEFINAKPADWINNLVAALMDGKTCLAIPIKPEPQNFLHADMLTPGRQSEGFLLEGNFIEISNMGADFDKPYQANLNGKVIATGTSKEECAANAIRHYRGMYGRPE